MFLLLVVSFIWAFSPGLIKGRLAGVDPTAIAVLRLALALLVFLPFLRPTAIARRLQVRLVAIGALQFGLMYVFYLRAFPYLKAYEIALFTITTPLFVTMIDAGLRRQFVLVHAAAALLAVLGGGVILWQRIGSDGAMAGVLFVQLSNFCFAAGQIGWRSVRARIEPGVRDSSIFALLYAGGLAASGITSLFETDWSAVTLSAPQWATVGYLGVLASGACFFWWNKGATRVNAGTLAAFNNAKIPLMVLCSIVFFGEEADLRRLALGGLLMAAGVVLAERCRPAGAATR